MSAVKLSVVVITFNEERNLDRCLKSVKEISDEIVVVDSFSTDKTEEIAKAHNARFYQHLFSGHVEQKNYALTKAENEWVLSLDADEVVDDRLKQEIIRVKDSANGDYSYSMNRLTWYCGRWVRHSGWYPDKKVRLFNRSKVKWGGVNPHDRIEVGQTRVIHLEGDILHYSYHSISDHVRQIDRFSSISAEMKLSQGRKVRVLIHLIFYPFFVFIKTYFLKLGFLDGYAGFVVAVMNAYYRFLKYAKLRELNEDLKSNGRDQHSA